MDAMQVKDWIDIITNVGFPIMLTLYLLIRFEKKIEGLSDMVERLKDIIRP
ncbi:YvrJ family protein [Ectobacillus sp. JY-23]|uniref:YvrJ family protein n=1 Tax=Ectobacillus sp. JY-23 TaxID=2933872 RepID=UPI001FF5D8DF|nr:YvrJ family protein [Ectobacillus sp. JY-23]UOY92288.1 YvrJ family protein [Ectobacillus sp. JY-23]